MAGRTPKLNWTRCLGQYTTCIRGRRYRLGTDGDEARRQFDFLLRRDGQAEEEVDPNPPFADLADRWLDHVEATQDAERYRLCKARLTEFTKFLGVGTRLRDLRPAHVEDWLRQKKPNAKKPGTQKLYKGMILACLNWSAKPRQKGGGGLVAGNPLRGQLALPEGDSRGGDALWSEKVWKQVLLHANEAFADVVRILRWTGCRPSLVCRVEAKHYNPTTKTWDVADLFRGRNSKKKAVRRIWLPDPARELVERRNDERPTGPIFLNGYGRPWNSAALQIYLYNMMVKFKETKHLPWPKGLCVYGLRHTFATGFIKQHPDKIEYLRELLGHRDLQMIRRHYGHLYDEHSAIHTVLGATKLPE